MFRGSFWGEHVCNDCVGWDQERRFFLLLAPVLQKPLLAKSDHYFLDDDFFASRRTTLQRIVPTAVCCLNTFKPRVSHVNGELEKRGPASGDILWWWWRSSFHKGFGAPTGCAFGANLRVFGKDDTVVRRSWMHSFTYDRLQEQNSALSCPC
jgi:hypothetical protein